MKQIEVNVSFADNLESLFHCFKIYEHAYFVPLSDDIMCKWSKNFLFLDFSGANKIEVYGILSPIFTLSNSITANDSVLWVMHH